MTDIQLLFLKTEKICKPLNIDENLDMKPCQDNLGPSYLVNNYFV